MAILLSLLAIVFLLVLQRVCQSRQLTPPPLRLPLIAAVAIPILTLVLASVAPIRAGPDDASKGTPPVTPQANES